jgi:alpha-glucuronidase
MNTEHPAGGYLVLAGVQVAPGPILAMVVDGSNVLADGAAPVRRIIMVRK